MATILLALALVQDAAREDALRRLGAQKVTVDFDGVRLADALDFLRDASGLNLVLLPSASAKDAEAPVRLKARELSVKSVLRLLLHGRGLTVAWRDGALAVLPREEVQDAVELKIYDVRSHLLKLRDEPGPLMELAPPSASGRPDVGVYVIEEPKPIVEEGFLLELVRSNTGRGNWETNGRTSVDLVNGRLVVSQTAATHREIAELLRRLGQFQ